MNHKLLSVWRMRSLALHPLAWKSLIAVLLLMVLWQFTWMPAWRTWVNSEQKHAQLEQQISEMRHMQQQLRQLQSQAPITAQASAQSLQTLASTLGKQTQVQQQAGQVQIQFKAVDAQQLAEFLSQAHQQSRARVLQASWQSTQGLWSGQIQFALPGAP
jgi:type II secretory pathway component PulM